MSQPYSLHDLFDQLGLDSSDAAIEAFIAKNSGLAQDLKVVDAPFWTEAQLRFLQEKWLQDADWVQAIDELNVRLH